MINSGCAVERVTKLLHPFVTGFISQSLSGRNALITITFRQEPELPARTRDGPPDLKLARHNFCLTEKGAAIISAAPDDVLPDFQPDSFRS